MAKGLTIILIIVTFISGNLTALLVQEQFFKDKEPLLVIEPIGSSLDKGLIEFSVTNVKSYPARDIKLELKSDPIIIPFRSKDLNNLIIPYLEDDVRTLSLNVTLLALKDEASKRDASPDFSHNLPLSQAE